MPYTKYAPVEEILDKRGLPRKSIATREEALTPTPAGVRSVGSASITAALQKQVRQDGHYFAMRFGAGSCVAARCSKYSGQCIGLKTGQCRFPGKVTSEGSAALYTDFYTLAAKMGFQLWIGAHSVFPEDCGDTPAYTIGFILIE